MKSFTVYEHKNTDAFRVVAGEHAPTHEVNGYKVRVYQGKDTITAAQTAYAAETRGDIRGQIARFIPESLSGGNPGEKLVRLPANHRGVVEARSSEGGNVGKVPAVSIQPREPVSGNRAPVGRASLEQLRAKDADPAPSISIRGVA